MAKILETSSTYLDSKTSLYEDQSLSYALYGYYERTGTTAKIYAQVIPVGGPTGVSASITGAKFHAKITGGSEQVVNNVSFSFPSRGEGSVAATIEFAVSYTADPSNPNKMIWGTNSSPKTIEFWVTDGSGYYDDESQTAITTGRSVATSSSTAKAKVYLPAINTPPTITQSVSVYNNTDFETYAIAGFTRFTQSVTYARSKYVVGQQDGGGVASQKTYRNADVQASSTGSYTYPVIPASKVDYTLTFRASATNSTSTVDATNVTKTVKGYSAPTYGSGTTAYRCNSQGQIDTQGTYGYLHLTWIVTSIGTNTTLDEDPTVKVNGTTLTSDNATITGSIQDGYFDYIFPLAANQQGDLEIKLVDQITSSTITNLTVSKQYNPLSLYQNGDYVGAAIGRICTNAGFWCYEPFYLKTSTSGMSDMLQVEVYKDSSNNVDLTIDGYSIGGGGGSSGMTLDALWTNSSPSTAFAGQTINDQDFTGYLFYIIKYRYYRTTDGNYVYGIAMSGIESLAFNPMYRNYRRAATINSTSVTFSDCIYYGTYATTTESTSNNNMIPQVIYGVK